jgi:hypothetical protein
MDYTWVWKFVPWYRTLLLGTGRTSYDTLWNLTPGHGIL